MADADVNDLREAIESQHGGIATLAQSVPVRERYKGETVWEGIVHIFDLDNHPIAKRAYAWSYERPDGKRRFVAVLHIPPVTGPRKAVRAAIVAEQRASQ